MKKILIFFYVLAFLFLTTQNNAYAADLNIECRSSLGCSSTGENPLFSKDLDGVWYPGRVITKTINFKNTGLEEKEVRLKAAEAMDGNLKGIMNVTISNEGNLIWTGGLENFFGQEISLGNLSPTENKEYLMNVAMESSADNSYQGKDLTFDLTLGFWEKGSIASESQSGGDNSSSGTVLGSNTSSINNTSALGENIEALIFNIKSSLGIEKTLKDVLGNTTQYAGCQCLFWQLLAGILLILLLLLTVYLLRKRIRHFVSKT